MNEAEKMNLYRQPEGTRFKTTVTIEYEAVAYEAYDGATRYLLSKDGIELGSFGANGLLQVSQNWKPLDAEKTPAQKPVPEVTIVPESKSQEKRLTETRAKTTPKAKEVLTDGPKG